MSEIREDLRNTLENLVSFGLGLLEAVFVLVCAALIARAMRRLVRRRLATTLAPENAKRIVENGVTLVVYLAAATLLLTFWGVTWSTLLAAIGVSTLVVALGLQGVLQSLIAGIFILFERPYNVGDRVGFSGHDVEGTVEEIALRTTVIRAEDGTRVVTPNSFVLTQAVFNHSPDRAVLTIVTVHGAGGSGRTTAETRSLVEQVLAEVQAFTASAEVVVRERFTKISVPRVIVRIPRFGGWADRIVRSAKDQATQVRVSWYGLNDPAVLDELLKRLGELFPDGRVALRRW